MAEESTAVSSAVSTTAEPKWHDSFDAEAKNYINERGLADKDPTSAFLEAMKAHRQAEAFIGAPKDQILRMPKQDAPPEEWDKFFERATGYSTKADDYKLEGLKFADGTEAQDSFKDFIRQRATELHLSPQATEKLAQETMKYLEANETAQKTEDNAAAVKAMEQLKNSWGPNYEANKVIADRGYEAIMKAAGFTQEQMTKAVQGLGELNGKAETMQMLLAVGQRLGEDKFVGGGGPSGQLGPRTAEEARAKIEELKKDSEFAKRWLAGGSAEIKQMQDLHTLAYGNA